MNDGFEPVKLLGAEAGHTGYYVRVPRLIVKPDGKVEQDGWVNLDIAELNHLQREYWLNQVAQLGSDWKWLAVAVEQLAAFANINIALIGALEEIVKMEGVYKRDAAQFYRGVIERNKNIAEAALAMVKGKADETPEA